MPALRHTVRCVKFYARILLALRALRVTLEIGLYAANSNPI